MHSTLKILGRLANLEDVDAVLPGHGAVTTQQSFRDSRRFIQALHDLAYPLPFWWPASRRIWGLSAAPKRWMKLTAPVRAVQLLLGHTILESTVRYLGIEVDDALAIAEQTGM